MSKWLQESLKCRVSVWRWRHTSEGAKQLRGNTYIFCHSIAIPLNITLFFNICHNSMHYETKSFLLLHEQNYNGCSFISCLPVDGLEKSSSLASCDVAVDSATNTQNAHASRQQRGKLSSLGKLFKPWKWGKKKTSDKFQDLSKGRACSVCVCAYTVWTG